MPIQTESVSYADGALPLTGFFACAPGAPRPGVLVVHGGGGQDPHVPMSQVIAFAEEMGAARADWQLLMLGGAVHGFTHRAATGAVPGVAFDAAADARAWTAMVAFFAEVFGAWCHSGERPL